MTVGGMSPFSPRPLSDFHHRSGHSPRVSDAEDELGSRENLKQFLKYKDIPRSFFAHYLAAPVFSVWEKQLLDKSANFPIDILFGTINAYASLNRLTHKTCFSIRRCLECDQTPGHRRCPDDYRAYSARALCPSGGSHRRKLDDYHCGGPYPYACPDRSINVAPSILFYCTLRSRCLIHRRLRRVRPQYPHPECSPARPPIQGFGCAVRT